MFNTRNVMAVVALAGAAASASAGPMAFTQTIGLTFRDPGSGRELSYTQPAGLGGLGALTYDSSVPVELSIQLGDFGILTPLLISSRLSLDVDVGPASAGALPQQFVASTFGDFTFVRASDNVPLIVGSFNDGSLARRRTAGGLEASGLIATPQFTITFIAALLAEFSNVGFNFPGFDEDRFGDLAFTLTNIVQTNPGDPAVITPPQTAEQFLSSFTADSAFTASIPVIPTPGAVGLAFTAGLMLVGKRRR